MAPWRIIGRSPGFFLTVVLTIAVGIGGTTAGFTLVDAVLLRRLPYADSDRLVAVKHAAPGLGLAATGLSTGSYFHYRRNSTLLEDVAVYSETVLTLSGGEGVTEKVNVTYAGPEFFKALRVTPAAGRLFTVEDGKPGFLNMTWRIPVLISHELWRTRFGSDPAIVGRDILLNQRARQVVGVLPEEFAFPGPQTQVWMLFMPSETGATFARQFDYAAIARLKPGATPQSAASELERLLPSIEGRYPDATAKRLAEVKLQPIVVPLKDDIVRDVRGGLWLLFGGMAVLLLVACSNVSNLFLLRAESRAKEMAVRIAIGGSPRDLFRLVMREALFLSLVGAAVGLPLALAGLKALAAFAPVELPRFAEVQINLRVLGFTSVVVLMTALFFSLLSCLRYSKHVALDLKTGGRTRGALIAAQVALALNLLVGAALMLQSFQKLTDVERGFESTDRLTAEIGLPTNKAANHQRIYADLLQRTRSLPGVLSGAAASSMPLTEGGYSYPLRVLPAETTSRAAESAVSMKFFTPGYFQTMKVAVLQGAAFDTGAPPEVQNPVAVSESLARRLFPGANPIGKKVLRLSSDGNEVQMFDSTTRSARVIAPWTVASVVADVREKSLRGNADEVVYIPLAGRNVEESIVPTNITLVMQFAGDPSILATSIRRTVSELDPALSVGKIRSMDAIVGASIARERFMAFLLLAVSSVSTLLGAVGISSVVAHAARRRRKEVGIRVALGAQVAHIVGLGIREYAGSVVAGLGFGAFLSYLTTQTLQSLLFGVSATDSFTVIAVAFLLLTIAFVASFVPALRAALVDPMTALRSE